MYIFPSLALHGDTSSRVAAVGHRAVACLSPCGSSSSSRSLLLVQASVSSAKISLGVFTDVIIVPLFLLENISRCCAFLTPQESRTASLGEFGSTE